MVEALEAYPCSSYHHNALGKKDGLITEHEIYKQISHTELVRRAAYRELFTRPLQKLEVTLVSKCVDKDEVLGGDRFHGEVEAETGFRTRRGKHGGDRKSELNRKADNPQF